MYLANVTFIGDKEATIASLAFLSAEDETFELDLTQGQRIVGFRMGMGEQTFQTIQFYTA